LRTSPIGEIRFLVPIYADFTSICCALAVFLVSVGVGYRKKTPLDKHIGRAVAASAVPSACVLILGAFDPVILIGVPGLGVHLALGGMALLYVLLRAAWK
jgi:hypothetical protein